MARVKLGDISIMKLIFIILNFVLVTSVFSMSAPPNCSEKTNKQRKTGYEYLPGVTAISAFYATRVAVKNIEDNRDGKKFSTDAQMFLTAVLGTVVGIDSLLSSSRDCRITDKKGMNFLREISNEDALKFRIKERKLRLKNLAINSGLAILLSTMVEGRNDRNSIYIAGTIPLAMAAYRPCLLMIKTFFQTLLLL